MQDRVVGEGIELGNLSPGFSYEGVAKESAKLASLSNEHLKTHQLGNDFTLIKLLLDKHNPKSRLELLKAVGGLYGLQVHFPAQVSALRAQAFVPKARRMGTPGAPSGSNGKANPRVKEIREKIKDLNLRISKASSEARKPLEPSHFLIQERNEFFRGLKEAKTQDSLGPGPKGPSQA